MKSWDTIIVGGGIIGLSLAIALRKQGMRVLIVERGEPGREASSAAAGMLVASSPELPRQLRPLAAESARLYPEFVHELEDESRTRVDLREHGTILLAPTDRLPENAQSLPASELRKLEPALAAPGDVSIGYIEERCLDPRALVAAAIKAARHRGVDIASGSEVQRVLLENGRTCGIESSQTRYSSPKVVNCAGAWSGCIAPERLPVRPVKGQMLAVVGGPAIKHVVRAEKVYLVPRGHGRIVIGSTLEEAGYNKQTDVSTIQQLLRRAVELAPELSRAKKHEDWAGLRPGTPDDLPILGETGTRGCFIASGHYRDGILLAPATAQWMTDALINQNHAHRLAPFSPARFKKN
jgi:glycine oxidase